MSIFISYTREPKEISQFASTLNEVLKTDYSVFYDKDSIVPMKRWREIIDAEVEKADTFIVLFSKRITQNNQNFFDSELEIIKISCNKRIRAINVIPVLFDSIEPNELPDFFRPYQTISDLNPEVKITKIKNALKKHKAEQAMIKAREERERIIKKSAAIGLPIIILIVVGILFFILTDSEKSSIHMSCKLFDGNYNLYQRYIFKDKDEYRIVANKTRADWKDIQCREEDNEIVLEGKDETYFEIESVIEGKFEAIAEVLYSYPSTVTLDKSTYAGKRRFGNSEQTYINIKNRLKTESELEIKSNEKLTFHLKNNEQVWLDISEGSRREKIETAIKELNKNFNDKKPHNCHVAVGEIDRKIVFAFICQEYTRIMMRN